MENENIYVIHFYEREEGKKTKRLALPFYRNEKGGFQVLHMPERLDEFLGVVYSEDYDVEVREYSKEELSELAEAASKIKKEEEQFKKIGETVPGEARICGYTALEYVLEE